MEREVEDADRYIMSGFPVVVQCRARCRPQTDPCETYSALASHPNRSEHKRTSRTTRVVGNGKEKASMKCGAKQKSARRENERQVGMVRTFSSAS